MADQSGSQGSVAMPAVESYSQRANPGFEAVLALRTAAKEGAFGAPIVFLHGANGTHKRWLAQVNALQHCSPFALDLPGHGMSTGTILCLKGSVP